ncbi:MAG: 6-phosphofructokinase [Planctomycetes bacterium]|nr:6-phosphofructokinase [Planctomycetota bacterium]
MKTIGVLTSGGDSPGMNAAIRSAVRTGIDRGMHVFGIRHGYAGLLGEEFVAMTARDVSGIIERGGTILGSARCPEFATPDGLARALKILNNRRIDGLVVIGGNGSQTGAHALARLGFPVVGVASTIDNDLFGTDISIGVDTALNIAVEAIDRLKVTAESHRRAFLVEVMGRDCGYLALMSAIAGGAEVVVIPEVKVDPEDIIRELRSACERGKGHALVVVAEGAQYNATGLADYFRTHPHPSGFGLRETILGHVQRGGTPGAFDRLLATRLASKATELLADGKHGVLVGFIKGEIATTPLDVVIANKKSLDLDLLKLAHVLAK